MIPGGRMAAVSSRFLREETFDLIVSPAIADPQFEAASSRLRRLRNYIGVWRACSGALYEDLPWTLRAPFADEARRVSLRSSVLTFAWLTLFQVCYYAGALTLAFSRWSDLQAWVHTVLLRTSALGASAGAPRAVRWTSMTSRRAASKRSACRGRCNEARCLPTLTQRRTFRSAWAGLKA